MTAEEYLNEHCKPEDWNNLEECLKDSILTNNVIEHMERYAALRIHDVVGRSEQLPPNYIPCGGCGAENPNERCINCFHDFGGN